MITAGWFQTNDSVLIFKIAFTQMMKKRIDTDGGIVKLSAGWLFVKTSVEILFGDVNADIMHKLRYILHSLDTQGICKYTEYRI